MTSTIITVPGFSNSYILKGDRAVIIDAGLPGQEKKILAALEANGISRDRVSLIIITHVHGDHYAGLANLKKSIDVPVMAGWPDAKFMEDGSGAPTVPVSLTGRVMTLFTGAKSPHSRADVIVKEDTDLRAYGVDGRVLTTPGHTFGSLSALASDGGCAIGDLLGGLIFKDRPGLPPLAEDLSLVGPSLKKVLDSGAKHIYPGHGNPWDAAVVRKKFDSIINHKGH
jgi:glyoxylase-like metal-dependent hydrolase (beta-lactamase superfamily II)